MKLISVFSILAISSIASAAHAQETKDDGVYLRVGAGATFVSDFEQDISYNFTAFVPALVSPSLRSVSTDAGYAVSTALGFDYADGIRTELEYRYANAGGGSTTFSGGTGGPFSTPGEDLSAHFIFANFYFDIDLGGPVKPFIGGGVGGAAVNDGMGGKDGALAYQGRGGFSVAVSSSVFISAEYIFTRTNDLEFGPSVDDFTPAGPFEPNFDGHYQSSSAMISVRKQF